MKIEDRFKIENNANCIDFQSRDNFLLFQDLAKNNTSKAEIETTESLKEQDQDEFKVLHPLILPDGGLGILAGYAKVGKSTLLPCLLEEIIETYPDIHILYYTLDENVIYTRRRLKAYPKLASHQQFKLIDFDALFDRAGQKGFTFDLIAEDISNLPDGVHKLVIIDSIGKIRELCTMVEIRTRLEEKEKVFLKIRRVLKSSKTTLFGIHHLTKVADGKLEKLTKIGVGEDSFDIAFTFMSSVKGSTFLTENADYIAVLIPNPANPKTERLLSITGRHILQNLTFCYERYFLPDYDFALVQKKEVFSISLDVEQVWENSECRTFLTVLDEKEEAKFSDIVDEVARRLKISSPDEQKKLLKRLWKKAFYGANSLRQLGLIEKNGKTLMLTDFGKQIVKLNLKKELI